MTVDTPNTTQSSSLGTTLAHPQLTALPAFADNYIWALRAPTGPDCLVVDPGDPAVVQAWLAQNGLILRAILLTHHHLDHVGGVPALRGPGVAVIGPRHDNISGLDRQMGEGERIDFPWLGATFTVLEIPGHTAGHIAFFGTLHDPDGSVDPQPLLFCGDTLFSGGCGRLFEGTPAQMSTSLARLAALPADTLVCCGHEYTAGNLRFAATVEPDNADIAACAAWVQVQRARGAATVPGDIAREQRINPFLRVDTAAVRAAAERQAGHVLPTDTEVFAVLRRWKDGFRL